MSAGLRKAFKIPLLKKTIDLEQSQEPDGDSFHAAKRRRVGSGGSDDSKSVLPHTGPATSNGHRTPLQHLESNQSGLSASQENDIATKGYYTVLWRKFTAKKHKTWDGDGVLYVAEGYATLQDVSGKDLGRTKFSSPLLPGSTLSISGKDVEVDSVISKTEFASGKYSARPRNNSSPPGEPKRALIAPKFDPPSQKAASEAVSRPLNTTAPKSLASSKVFKTPSRPGDHPTKISEEKPVPRHDPERQGALIMKRPASAPPGKQIVDVVVDPILSDQLRPHQREGVTFMYECVMGLRPFNGQGAVLADEMGLGKTLQTITLLWTLLRQNPVHDSAPVIRKALVVCPVTLIKNWRREFRKWLGPERIGVFVADGSKTNIRDFTMGRSYSVMIIGYERLRSVAEELQRGPGIDIVIADEGHRLKTAQNKSAQAIKSLDTERRVILSGTPIQNDLSEFWVMVDFVNPGLLGTYNSFRKGFESPIVKSRQPGVSKKDIAKGESRSEELSTITKMFILRRTAELLAKFLPPKTEYILFCRPTTAQAEIYRSVVSSSSFGSIRDSSDAALQLINALHKVCNSPTLLSPKINEDKPSNDNVAALLSDVPFHSVNSNPAQSSSKLRVLDRLLYQLRETTQEKVVLVSNYTSTLDLLQTYLTAQALPFLRLDGSTPASKRQDLVEDFNRSPASRCFAFLLSAKAGGMGLNLIGASRLVLFEVDWNPSTDAQAMARIHRDGQKRDVKIYRLVLAGGLDEKIWQRQVTKMGLADSVMDHQKVSSASFSIEELRDLFTLDTTSTCQTHDLIGCACQGTGSLGKIPDESGSENYMQETNLSETSDGEDERELPEVGSLVRASQVDMDTQERRITEQRTSPKARSKEKSSLQSLMRYSHIDTASLRNDPELRSTASIDDDVLMEVLMEEGNRVSYLFSKASV